MEIKDIQLSDREWLSKELQNIGGMLSEYSFSNLYLFREKHNYKIIKEDGCVFIQGISYDGLTYIMPTCDFSARCPFSMEKLISKLQYANMLFPMPESVLSYFPQDKFKIEFSQDDMDYIFTREKLRDYPGKKLHKKRNLVKQFTQHYRAQVVSLNIQGAKEKALSVLDHWQKASPLDENQTDYYPCKEALSLYNELELEGFLFLVNEEPVGFTIGEKISEKVYGLHFAKGNTNYKGIYQFMFSQTAALVSQNYEWINLEQDLGSVALRAAKSSYYPDKMGKKMRIFLQS